VDDKEAAESEAGKAYGTPYYISPEQIRGDVDIDFRADIYSLGATFYHLVTGAPPFEGETPAAVMHKHLKQPLVPADHINTALSAGLGEVIDVCMAKKREERFASTAELLEDLKAIARNQPPVHARRAVDLGTLEKLESGKTVDISSPAEEGASTSIWSDPRVIIMAAALGVAVLGDLVLLLVNLLHH